MQLAARQHALITDFDSIFLGSGPAGTGPLICAIQRADHERLLARGVLWLDASHTMVAGTLGRHQILSDTASDVLLECLTRSPAGLLSELLSHPATAEVKSFTGGPLPLPVAGRFLTALGDVVQRTVMSSQRSAFIAGAVAARVEMKAGGFVVDAVCSGRHRSFTASKVVFALGGYQERRSSLQARIAGTLRLADGWASKTMISSDLMTFEGQRALAERLSSPKPRMVVLGSSHSAITSAWLALHRTGADFESGGLRILCRRLPKLFYPSRAAALADSYTAWDDTDVCPVTGRVFRLAGLRMHARDLIRSAWRLGSSPPEERLRLETIDPQKDEETLRSALDEADVVVAAFGYRPRMLPIYRNGELVKLRANRDKRAPLVDDECRLIDDNGAPVSGVFAIGLASGFVPHGDLGGEPSFDGQTNGLWLYQNGVGEIVLDHLLA